MQTREIIVQVPVLIKCEGNDPALLDRLEAYAKKCLLEQAATDIVGSDKDVVDGWKYSITSTHDGYTSKIPDFVAIND